MSFLLWVFVYWGSVSLWWVSASRREAFPVWSRWLWAILRRVFQSTETYARAFWWVRVYSCFSEPDACFFFSFFFCFKRRCAAVASLSVCFESMCSVPLHRWCALPRWEASSLRNLREDVLPVRQQERPHEEETWRGGARERKQGNRFLSHTRCARRIC